MNVDGSFVSAWFGGCLVNWLLGCMALSLICSDSRILLIAKLKKRSASGMPAIVPSAVLYVVSMEGILKIV